MALRVRWGFLSIIAAVLLGCAVTAVVWYLRSERFQHFAQSVLITRVEKETGLRCEVAGFRLDLFRGAFAIEGFRLMSAAPHGPLNLNVEKIQGSFVIIALFRSQFHLKSLLLDRPHLVLTTGRGGDAWNPEALLKTLKISLAVEAGQVTIQNGSLDLNEMRIPLDAVVRGFSCDLKPLRDQLGYGLKVSYQDGVLAWGNRRLAYALDTGVNLTMAGLEFTRLSVRFGGSHLTGQGWLKDWAAPGLVLRSQGVLPAQDLGLLHPFLRDGRGNVNVTSDLLWDASSLHIAGKFSVPSGEYRQTEIRGLQGAFEVRDGALTLRSVAGAIGRADLRGTGVFQVYGPSTSPHRLDLSVANMVLSDGARMLHAPAFAFTNEVDATTTIVWRRGIEDLRVTGKVALHGASAGPNVPGRSTAFAGSAEFTYDKGSWQVQSANFQSPDSSIEAAGNGSSSIRVRASTSRLSEPLDVLRSFSASVEELLQRAPDLLAASGAYRIDGTVRLEGAHGLSYQGSLDISKGRWRAWQVDTLSGTALWTGGRLELQELKVQKGEEAIDGKVMLDFDLDGIRSPDFSFEGNLRRISLASLKDIGLNLETDLSGILHAQGRVVRKSDQWSGEGELEINPGRYRGETFDSLRVRAVMDHQLLRITNARWKRAAAEVQIDGQVRMDTKQVDLSARLARMPLGDIPFVRERHLDLAGNLTASGEIHGPIEHPGFQGTFSLDDLRYGEWDLGRGEGAVDFSGTILSGSVRLRSDLGSFDAQVRLSNEPGYPGRADLRFQNWNIQRIIAAQAPPFLRQLSTALEGRLELQGRFAEPATLGFRGELDGARFKIRDYELHNSGRILFEGANRKLQLSKADIAGEGTRLALSGQIPLDASPTLDLNLIGDVNPQILQNIEDKIRISGATTLNVRAGGALRDPQVIGQAMLKDVRVEYADLPLRLASLGGAVIFSRNLVRFENVRGSLGTGTAQVAGVIEHQAGDMKAVNLQISVRNARFPYPKDFRSTIDADLVLRGNAQAQLLSGQIEVLKSEYLRDFSILERLINQSSAPSAPVASTPFLLGLRLDIAVRSDNGLLIENDLARARAGLNLSLGGTAAYPSLMGRVEATEGNIFFRGSRFDIVHASVDFVDRNAINPLIDVRAEADVKSYRLQLEVGGALNRMTVNLTSDPPLATVDIISLLTTGKSATAQTENSRYESEITGLSAASILSESLTGVIGKRVQRLFGFQTFRVDPFLAGAANDPTARVTISERISRDVTLTFSRNLSTNEEQIVILEYDVNRKLTIVASRDENGKFGLDFRFRSRFR